VEARGTNLHLLVVCSCLDADLLPPPAPSPPHTALTELSGHRSNAEQPLAAESRKAARLKHSQFTKLKPTSDLEAHTLVGLSIKLDNQVHLLCHSHRAPPEWWPLVFVFT
jgi:hypothetical protein